MYWIKHVNKHFDVVYVEDISNYNAQEVYEVS